jgi:hypothetical protein
MLLDTVFLLTVKHERVFHSCLLLQVVEGQNIVHKMEQVKTDSEDHPLQPVVITESGILATPSPFYISDESYE